MKERCQIQSCLLFPPLLHGITTPSSWGRGCRKAKSLEGLFQSQRKCPFSHPFGFPGHCSSRSSTEMSGSAQRPDPPHPAAFAQVLSQRLTAGKAQPQPGKVLTFL